MSVHLAHARALSLSKCTWLTVDVAVCVACTQGNHHGDRVSGERRTHVLGVQLYAQQLTSVAYRMPEITANVSFDTIAREWRCKWSPDADKASLSSAQDLLASVLAEVSRCLTPGCMGGNAR